MKKYLTLFALIGLMVSPSAWAQTEASSGGMMSMDSNQMALLIIIGVIIGVIILLLILMIYLMSFISAVFRKENPALAEEPSWWDSFKERFVTGDIEEEQAHEKLMSDHSYDGIQELDNFMPPWLQYVFIGTIVFAVGYYANYTVFGIGMTGIEEYEEELRIEAIAAESRSLTADASIDETNVTLDDSGPALGAGKTIFEANCAACHAIDGGGGVGPNLTDKYWLHGGDIKDVFAVVKYGVIEKGMVPWEDQLNPKEIQEVSSYILSLQGTTPAAPKDPQGELYSGGSTSESEAPAESMTAADTTAVVTPAE
ncbi:cbb3-type cytochrome c oxidase N-terminal domain-containing protein [Algoriphagus aquimarinus]|uniref:Cytochrome c oxidase cbb3-type subunit 3 n=1 Tax=Algoriphagus aquimarinus TaxID=237018 RepID=A0A1I1BWN5_9BACT|nr:cbb3-type cytochrome c oxidase N-terminal domain-containing protein [Algoriphagus aquimarinus]SFB52900.1 cytochrome c oxidase cbb3-type subunit 3 [Algoriphagus aquimarinus]